MSETAVKFPSTQRRRSERVSASIPVSIHGTDLLGQPFSERTTTVNFNLHGCRYTSRHQLPKNSWVTVEMPAQAGGRAMRARVVWIQKPHSIREYFQVAVEMESPGNIWGLESPPADWRESEEDHASGAEAVVEINVLGNWEQGRRPLPANLANYIQELVAHMTNESPMGFPASSFAIEGTTGASEGFSPDLAEVTPIRTSVSKEEEQPLLQSVSAEIERRAKEAVEAATAEARRSLEESSHLLAKQIQRFHDELEERAGSAAGQREADSAAREKELAERVRGEIEQRLAGARDLFTQLDEKVKFLQEEKEAAQEASSRMAQARLQIESSVAATVSNGQTEAANEAVSEAALAGWRARLDSERTVAEHQWSELLQSSLDASVHRLIAQISGRSQEILADSERQISERFGELQNSFLQAAAEARHTLGETKTALEEEVARAGFSLAEIEHSASRMKEYSAQLEAASHDSLNGLHRRLEKILEDQTAEMSRRAEGLAMGVVERTGPALESLAQETLGRATENVQQVLAPHHERAAELIRELKARELQGEDSLRLHRERLRQISEQSQREAAAQMNSTVGNLRADFEGARKEALTKWTEELDASGVRASHAAAESIGRASEWFQQEARTRLQVQAEQTVAASAAALEEKFSHLTGRFESHLEEKSSAKSQQVEARLDQVAGELAGRSSSQIEEAARAAAASFGQVIQEISGKELEHFSQHSQAALEERMLELEHSAQRHLRTLESTVETSLGGFQTRMGEQLEAGIAHSRGELAEEFARSMESYRTERARHQESWAQSLESVSNSAAGRFEERLETSSDSFVVSSVRRLNEHGQNTVESLLRSTEQSIRDSFSRVFDGLATALRERSTNAAAVSGFSPPPRDASEPPLPRNEASGISAGA